MNTETRDEMPYQNPPETEFQRYIRSTKYGNSTFLSVHNLLLIIKLFLWGIVFNCNISVIIDSSFICNIKYKIKSFEFYLFQIQVMKLSWFEFIISTCFSYFFFVVISSAHLICIFSFCNCSLMCVVDRSLDQTSSSSFVSLLFTEQRWLGQNQMPQQRKDPYCMITVPTFCLKMTTYVFVKFQNARL